MFTFHNQTNLKHCRATFQNMSEQDKQMESQYLVQQMSFLKEAKLNWTNAIDLYTNKVICELDTWLGDPKPFKTFPDMSSMAQNAVILITERCREVKNLSDHIDPSVVKNDRECSPLVSRPFKSNDHDMRNVQSRLENVENVISSLRATSKFAKDKQKKLDRWVQRSTRTFSSHQNFIKNRTKKLFSKLKHVEQQSVENKSSLDMLAESVAEIERKETRDETRLNNKNIYESELNSLKESFYNQNKISDDWKENLNTILHNLSVDIRSLDENYQSLFARFKNEMENLQEIISSIKDENKSMLEDKKNYKEMELKYGMLCQMLLKKVSSVEKFQVAVNQKIGQKTDCPNQQKLDQVSFDLESVTRTLTDLKHSLDTISARIDSWPPPPPHPFHHDHPHRRHHHRHC